MTGDGTVANAMGMAGLMICTANVPDKIAVAVDTQMDDQSSLTGNVRAQLQAGTNPAITGVGPQYVETGGSTQYLMCKGVL
jgi:hypothetical protein